MNYMPQLDGLRALSILLVCASHWVPWSWEHHAPFSGLGVEIFFILSGYLITMILLRDEHSSKPKGVVLKNFFARRFLRIFPLYYAVLFGLLIVGFGPAKQTFFWNLFYATNILTFKTQNVMPGVGHFWTLAMEEQFYLVWPFVVLFTPLKKLPYIMIGMMIVATATRAYLYLINVSPGTFPICCLDFLGFGGLLAYYKKYCSHIQWPQKYFGPAALVCLIIYWAIWFLELYGLKYMATTVLFNSLALVYLGWLVLRAAGGFGGLAGKALDNPAALYLGKISYGLYIFHNFIYVIYNHLGLGKLYLYGPRLLLAQMVLLIAVASLSWFFFEKPILSLKKTFV